MVTREALTLEGAWCVGADAIVTHVPGLTLIHICRARGCQRARVGWSQASTFSHGCPWPGALELRPVELERITGTSPYSHVHITRGNQATCCQGPWACLIPNSLGLLILHPSSPDKRCPPPASPALPWASLPQLLPLWFSPFSPTWLPSFPHK